MLLEFRLANYRSFGKESAFSLVASGDSHLQETNSGPTGIESLPRALRTSVVYGANASGKSNLLRAMQLMRAIVLESFGLQPGQMLNVQPFRLDKALRNAPTLFEVTVLLGGIRHQYGFECTPSRIVSEWLLVYQKAKPQRWFDRRMSTDLAPGLSGDNFEFSSFLSGPKRTWQEATRPNALFLSTAVQLNSEQLLPLHRWFAESLIVLLDGGQIPFNLSTELLQTESGHAAVRNLLSSADLTISNISAVRRKAVVQQVHVNGVTGETNSERTEKDLLFPTFRHEVDGVVAELEYQDESQGTQKLFSLAGMLLDVIRNGRVLMIDELDRSLHPLLVRQIVRTFQDPTQSKNGAQLIFSTHDTSLLDHRLLRRDQIWLVERRRNQSSELIPLSEFSPRKGEALEKGYLSGRYGGVPILKDELAVSTPDANQQT